ncbi:uncharacterized protein METZ01_LOCUS430236 [marine metagenome]|uniref:Uncharacterized protein n=1 Tax=marine metagenome TaxID=408172 RepID=A0A382Y215_9ZZZZ
MNSIDASEIKLLKSSELFQARQTSLIP